MGYKDLFVWQKSVKLVLEIYRLTEDFPSQEKFGLTSQIRRAAVSIPSNIAEGSRRGSKKDFKKFLLYSFGSGSEVETQIIIAKNLQFGREGNYLKVDALLGEVMKMLNKLIHIQNE